MKGVTARYARGGVGWNRPATRHRRRQVERVARACRQTLETARALLRHSRTEARRAILDLRASALERGDLASALQEAATVTGSGLPVRIPVRVEGPPRRLSGTTEAHLLRIAQEAMSNAIKHGRAEEVALTLALSMQVACIRSHNRRITAMTTRTLMIACLTGLFVLSATGNAVAVEGLELGTNFWNPGWHRPSDCFRDLKNVSGEDPWNPQFLKEVAIFKSLRFMDWDNTNGSMREKWGERPHKSDRKQNPVAYEWMIDLCNRQHADLWVTLPHRTVTHAIGDRPCDYALRLCLLVKTGVDMGEVDLQPLLDRLARMKPEELIAAGGKKSCEPLSSEQKLYVEYSNETWNGMFKQAHYCCDEGEALGLDKNPWTAGFRYHAWAAIRIFRAADLVFGAESPRVVKVLATHIANSWITGQHLLVLADPKLNPWGLKASAVAAAPYFGHKVDGAAPDAVDQLREAIRQCAEQSAKQRKLSDGAGLKLIAYEGGQHVLKSATAINRSPAMHDLYLEYLREMSKYYSHFSHYCHVGRAGDHGAWGAIEFTGQPVSEAPKYLRAAGVGPWSCKNALATHRRRSRKAGSQARRVPPVAVHRRHVALVLGVHRKTGGEHLGQEDERTGRYSRRVQEGFDPPVIGRLVFPRHAELTTRQVPAESCRENRPDDSGAGSLHYAISKRTPDFPRPS